MPNYKHFLPRSLAAGLLLIATCGLTSCNTPIGQGAAIGAGSGAIIGGLATNRVGGAALGAAAGAVAGTLVGAAVEQANARQYGEPPREGYPVATPTDHRGLVISPYKPHYEIDVTGVPHHELVRDPSCDRLFVNP